MFRHSLSAFTLAAMLSLPVLASAASLAGVTNYYSDDPIGFCPNEPCPKLFHVNTATGASVQTADIDTFYGIQDIAVSRKGPIYATGYQPDLEDSVLLRYNPKTNATRVIGGSTSYAQGIEFDNKGRLFRYSTEDGLTRVNPNTGRATVIGGGPKDIGDMAFGGNRMYALEQIFTPIAGGGFDPSTNLVTINLKTGNTTTIGQTPLPFSFSALAFKDNQLFSSYAGQILSINPSTGQLNSSVSSAVDFDAMGGAAPVPLPPAAPLLVVALGVLGALAVRRRSVAAGGGGSPDAVANAC